MSFSISMKSMALSVFLAFFAAAPAFAVDDPSGLEQLRKAAEGGNVEAMVEIGILYEFGFNMADHKAHALAWYRLASDAGDAKASSRLDALKSSANTKEMEDANRLYDEIRAGKTAEAKPADAASAPTAAVTAAPAPAPVTDAAPAPAAK